MSELKRHHINEVMDMHNLTRGEMGYSIVYYADDVDKVIANRDYEIKELKDSLGKLLRAKTEQIMDEVMQKTLIYGEGFVRVEDAMKLIAELRHHKYKRCLAMAWWCSAELGMLVSTWEFKIKHYKKWHKRWLELAEKFKEAK